MPIVGSTTPLVFRCLWSIKWFVFKITAAMCQIEIFSHTTSKRLASDIFITRSFAVSYRWVICKRVSYFISFILYNAIIWKLLIFASSCSMIQQCVMMNFTWNFYNIHTPSNVLAIPVLVQKTKSRYWPWEGSAILFKLHFVCVSLCSKDIQLLSSLHFCAHSSLDKS